MELKPALGSAQMQAAWGNPRTHSIADLLIQAKTDPYLFFLVTQFIKKHVDKTSFSLEKDLAALRSSFMGRPAPDGTSQTSQLLETLITRLIGLYEQGQETIDYQRGAIVEVLAWKLVKKRYTYEACKGNQIFTSYGSKTDQVDVAVLDKKQWCIEAYTCKVNVARLKTDDCDNIFKISTFADYNDFIAHFGVISLDDLDTVKDEIEERMLDSSYNCEMNAYGYDNIFDLEESPF